jgi:hypothetical protein
MLLNLLQRHRPCAYIVDRGPGRRFGMRFLPATHAIPEKCPVFDEYLIQHTVGGIIVKLVFVSQYGSHAKAPGP